ncbi:checkpoint clamp complex protein Rad1 [Saxophila tyrrhenica]|uniref:Checkpoint clamp complex protein Rad1 n=1 Tax=Saxophila tyrrhenica TaxID=1690608 RepID=A0AAV9NY59_9PEZI|nr:checkpoint clamp complex protein Rad1 [Saxophila tyrrhenica]
MAASPLLSAVTSSSRQLLLLLRCISFAKKAQVRISPEGIRISIDEGSIMEAFVFLEKALFTTYKYQTPQPRSAQDDSSDPPVFEISMTALLEILNIFSLSDPTTSSKRPGFSNEPYDANTAHRLHRHAGLNAFSNTTLGITGTCSLTYEGEGSPLSIHMSESDVTTTCDLTTYTADSTEEIPFNRDHLALKTIIRSANLLDSITELSSLNPAEITIQATPNPSRPSGANFTFTASGPLGSANVEFTQDTSSDTPILETFFCPTKTEASFKFSLIKAAQRAMASATKVSLRLDEEGVLSLQFLVEMEVGGVVAGQGGGVAFVDFRVVPLVDDERGNGVEDGSSDEEM